MTSQPLPIGYYLKKTDHLLTKTIDQIQTSFGISRIQWQMLHSIYAQPHRSRFTLLSPLVEFENEEALNGLLDTLLKKGLVLEEAGLSLTESGVALQAACWQKQAVFRQQAMAGVSEAAYGQVIDTLKIIINNISALSDRQPTDGAMSD